MINHSALYTNCDVLSDTVSLWLAELVLLTSDLWYVKWYIIFDCHYSIISCPKYQILQSPIIWSSILLGYIALFTTIFNHLSWKGPLPPPSLNLH